MLQVNYEARGWVAHQVLNLWAKTSPDRGQAVWALWPMGGAWFCTHLRVHYTYILWTRSWKEELATFPTSSSAGALALLLQYLRIVKLQAKIWLHFISPRKLLLGKLETTVVKEWVAA